MFNHNNLITHTDSIDSNFIEQYNHRLRTTPLDSKIPNQTVKGNFSSLYSQKQIQQIQYLQGKLVKNLSD